MEKYTSFYQTIVSSKEWTEWRKVAEKKGFDVEESTECDWLSEDHWKAFIRWVKKQ